MWIRSLCLLLAAAPLACTAPIKTVRLDSRETEVKGVRYTLMRPVYQVALRVPAGHPPFAPLARYAEIHIPKQDPDGNPSPLYGDIDVFSAQSKSAPDSTRERCLRGEAKASERCKIAYQSACAFGNFNGEIVLLEELKGEAIYEIRGAPWYSWPLHAFSDTDVSIVLDDDGRLSSLAAGETDKTLEFVQAVAGIAVRVAGADAVPLADGAERCHLVPVADGFMEYLERHDGLRVTIAGLKNGIEVARGSLRSTDPEKQKAAVEALAAMETQLASAQKTEKGTSHPLHPTAYRLEMTRPPRKAFFSKKTEEPLVINAGGDAPILTATLRGK